MKPFPLILIGLSASLLAQQPSVSPVVSSPTPQSGAIQVGPPPTHNPFTGSVPSSDKLPETFRLTLDDALQRGLRQNLGLVLGGLDTRLAEARELRARSQFLPSLTGRIGDTEQQINLAAYGFNFKIPGASIPTIVGPFNVFDARVYLTQTLLDFQLLNNSRAAGQLSKAAAFTQKDAREVVTLAVASAYLQVVAGEARVEEARTEVETADALYQRAQDQLKNGLAPALDALRAQVELQLEQTRLRSLQNGVAKDKLGLARLIGLPLGQNIVLTDRTPYAELVPLDLESAIALALKGRSDYQSSEARLHAAESAKRAALAERYPVVDINADYGDQGPSPWNSHGTFSAGVGVRFPLFVGGRIRSDVEEADTELQQRKAELQDIRGRIELDVRSALLDLETAADQVRVARSSADLARQALTQARDRFSAGVADNIEVVQAQNAVATATTTFIDSQFSDNVAKVALARAMGVASKNLKQYLKGQ